MPGGSVKLSPTPPHCSKTTDSHSKDTPSPTLTASSPSYSLTPTRPPHHVDRRKGTPGTARMDAKGTSTPSNPKSPETSDHVDQNLKQPVAWSKKHFDIFKRRRPPPDAKCEICMEKIIAVEESDVDFLREKCQQLDPAKNGSIGVDDMKSVLTQLKRNNPNIDMIYLNDSIVSNKGMIDYNRFLDTYVTIQLDCCRILCVCLPSRWMHNPCLKKKIALGVNGCADFLLQCGACRTSVWGTRYGQWLTESRHFLDCAINLDHEERREHARKAYTLAVNVMNAIVRCGSGGLKHNVLLGVCLSFIGTAIYQLQTTNEGSEPLDLLSGKICSMGLRMGAPPTIHNAWILGQMCLVKSVVDNNKEKQSWLDLATECVTDAIGSMPLDATAHRMAAACTQLTIDVLYPGTEVQDVTKMLENRTFWPWGIDELTVMALFSICGTIGRQYGLRHVAKYVRRGVALDPQMFDGMHNHLECQIQSDIVWMNACLSNTELTNDQCIGLGDSWTWEKTRLDVKARTQISEAYKTKGLAEESTKWCGIGVSKN